MQTVTVIAVGKVNAAYYRQAAQEYEKRLTAYCRLRVIELAEQPMAEKRCSPELIRQALEKEAQAILAAVPKGAHLTALCVEGKQVSSEQLAECLAQQALYGQSELAFAVGSSHGLATSVKQRAQVQLSISAMTFPHQLARVLLLEQLYRAYSINAGANYHK